jgi:ribosome-associated protein
MDNDTPVSTGIELAPGVRIAAGNLRFSFSRSSGPGGQAVNKLNTRATLRVTISGVRGLDEHAVARLRKLAGSRLTRNDEIVISAETSRSQLDNKNECLARLSELVARAFRRPRKRTRTKPTRAMIERRLQSKRRQSQKKTLRQGRSSRGEDA